MLTNILKLTLRNLLRNSLYTGINILGLAIGLTVFLCVLTFVRFESNFNTSVDGHDRIYRLYSKFDGVFSGFNRGVNNGAGPYLKENFSSIETVAQIHTWGANTKVRQGDGSIKDLERQAELVITSPDLFELINTWDWEAGSMASMNNPRAVALLRSQAEKYFGDLPSSEYLGKEVIYQDSLQVEVVGILSDPVVKTDFVFTDFISIETAKSSFLKENYDYEDWNSTSSSNQVFVKFRESSTRADLDYVLSQLNEQRALKNEDDSFKATFEAQPLSELHYNTTLGVFDNASHAADRTILRNVLLISIAILVLAIVNFINLETAIGGKRGREIGIRKVFGSQRVTVMIQFLVQSTLMTFVAIIIAVPLTQVGLRLFSDFLPEGISFAPFEFTNLALLLLIGLLVGFIAGFYPAMVMSAFRPVTVLKTQMTTGTGGNNFLRKGLTLFQFTFSQVLLIITFIIFNQIDFMINKDLGFEKENILIFSTPYYLPESRSEVLYNELSQQSGISEMVRFGSAPIENGWSSSIYDVTHKDGSASELEVFIKNGDSTYTTFFGIEQLSGRSLRNEKEILINEAFMKELGYDNPIDVLDIMIDPDDDSLIVAGVVSDFHFRSLHNEIKPMAIRFDSGRTFGIKLEQGADSEQLIAGITDAFKGVYPDSPFNHQFYQNSIEKYYESEKRTSRLIVGAAGIALLISCLGLFGLSSYMAIQRTKEIGIRKVQGASAANIIRLLTTDFLKLVAVAVVLAIPLAWWAGTTWLDSFAYRAPVSIWLFVLAAFIAVIIAFLTISYHALTAARANPVLSLRSE